MKCVHTQKVAEVTFVVCLGVLKERGRAVITSASMVESVRAGLSWGRTWHPIKAIEETIQPRPVTART